MDTPRAEYMRLYPLEDIHILRSADGGDGRTVEAFAAVFDDPAEIQDHEGHYVETIDRSAFNKVIADAARARGGFPGSVKVLYNHGMTLNGSPSDADGLSAGHPHPPSSGPADPHPVLRHAAGRGSWRTSAPGASRPSLHGADRPVGPAAAPRRYRPTRRTSPSAAPNWVPRYGPSWPYSGAEIFGVTCPSGTWEPDEHDDAALPPDGEAAAGEPLTRADGEEHSARYHQHQLFLLESQKLREAAGLVW
jgi:hypothetical protein